MRVFHRLVASLPLFFTAVGASAATHHKPIASHGTHKKTVASSSSHTSHSTARAHSTTARKSAHGHASTHTVATSAPQHMEPERATAIQQALIRGGYLTGEPSGEWDSDSQAAMRKLQGDNGWQTKIVPDSRALIKLGLGPQQ